MRARVLLLTTLVAVLAEGTWREARAASLAERLSSEDAGVVEAALEQLGSSNEEPLAAYFGELRRLLSGGDEGLRFLTLRIVGLRSFTDVDVAKALPQLAPTLIRSLNDESERIRGVAAEVLARTPLGPPAEAVEPLIAVIDRDPKDRVRAAAITALSMMTPPPQVVVERVVSALRDDSSHVVRIKAARALESLGRHFPGAARVALQEALHDESRLVVMASAGALGGTRGIGDEGSVSALEDLAERSTDEEVKAEAERWADALRNRIGSP